MQKLSQMVGSRDLVTECNVSWNRKWTWGEKLVKSKVNTVLLMLFVSFDKS